MAPIKMPATPKSAYDPKRPANALLLTQVRELEKALSDAGRQVRRKKPKTEEQVAAYIRHLNRALFQQMALPAFKRRPLDVPSAGPSVRASPKKRKGTPRKRTSAATSRKKATARPKRHKRSRS